MVKQIQVLHVDDDPQFADLVSTFLESERDALTVETASVASDGIDYLAENDVDCVVSDYDMPGMNGLQFLQAIREANWQTPFILYTGKGSEEIASEAISAGVSEYLQKETGTSQYTVLANRITNVVEQFRAKKEAETTEERLTKFAQNVDDILYMFDAEWETVLFVNSAYEELWGSSVEELQANPQSFLDYVHPADASAVEEAMKCASSGEAAAVEYRVETSENSYRWVRSCPKPVFDNEGNVEHIVGYASEITDEIERKRELERERERMQFAMDVTNSYVYQVDIGSDAEVRYGAFEELYNISSDELETSEKLRNQAIHPDDRQRVAKVRESIVSGETKKATVEFRTHPDNGPVRWLRGTIYRDESEETLNGLVTDITEKKTQQVETHEEKQFIENALDSLNDILYVIDESGQIIRWNEQGKELTGYTEEEIRGRPATEFVSEDDQGTVAAGISEVFATGFTKLEADLVTRDGERVPHEFRAAKLFQDDSPRIVGIGRDISERVARENELQRSQRRFEAIFNDPNILVGMLEPDGKVIDINETAISIIEQTSDDVIGEPFWETPWWNEDDKDRVQELVAKARDNEYLSFQAEHSRENRDSVFVDGQFRPVTDSDGTVQSIIVSARDITEEVTRKQELEMQAEKMEEFAGFLSHDMQNPISSLEGWLELAIDTGEVEHIEKAQDSLRRIDQLREELTDVVRSGMVSKESEPVRIDSQAAEIWEQIDPPEAASLELDAPIPVTGDANAIQRLIENLMMNSIEHGSNELRAKFDTFDDGFYYEDNGPGIPQEKREAVFSPGYSTKADSELVGMGLASVREIVRGHDWSIRIVDGDSLGGARFEITTT